MIHSFILIKLEMQCLQMGLVSVTTASSSNLNLSRTLSRSTAFSFSLHRPLNPLSISSAALRLPRCRAASPGPPLPPSENDSTHLEKGADVATSLSQIQDRIKIFFAVLFWMSLFFWASAWDGRNRPNKGSRFRK